MVVHCIAKCIPDSAAVQNAVDKDSSVSEQTRRTEHQAANKKPKLSTELPKRTAFLPASRKPPACKTDTASQTQSEGKPRQVGEYDRPWRAYMKAAGGDRSTDQQKQAEHSLPAKNAVKPAVRAKVHVLSHNALYQTGLSFSCEWRDKMKCSHWSNDTQGAHSMSPV